MFNSDFFIYVDAGSFRERIYANWPNLDFVEKVKSFVGNRILVGQVNPVSRDSYNPSNDYIAAGFFAGSKIAVANWARSVYKLHDEMLANRLFIGKEQTLYNMIALEKNRNSTVKLKAYENNCVNPWWFFQLFLAQDEDSTCLKKKLSFLAEESD